MLLELRTWIKVFLIFSFTVSHKPGTYVNVSRVFLHKYIFVHIHARLVRGILKFT